MVFNGTTDCERGTIRRTEFTINQIVNLVLSFEIEELVVKSFSILANGDLSTGR